jgi:uncharacterized protein (DUF2461 family)
MGDKKTYIDNSRFMEFVDEMATQLTELNFHEDTFWFDAEQNQTTFTEEAQDFYNERYDEIETMVNNMMGVYKYTDMVLHIYPQKS